MNKNTYTPSKELLSDVFNKEVLIISDDTEWVEEKMGESLRANDICIIFAQTDYNPYIILDKHALAHKVKEWAFEQGYELFSKILSNDHQIRGNCLVLRVESDPETVLKIENADTEPEAIFEAGEWILSQAKLS